ncbi:hypothetical protein GYMLUDRAFT_952548 [Collybiopsis luxurians FD-317 M1]|nr:hypothetical protein GYMLUDRAFT_952548 [Collybiopsis luxurians FD-317 M1]
MPTTTKFESDVTAIEYGRRSTLVGRGPVSNVTCQSGFQWAFDSAGNSPCLVAAAVAGGCGTANHTVTPLTNSTVHYNQPGIGSTPDKCSCSWAAYNLYSACTACQGFDGSILTWADYNGQCGSLLSSTTYYPSDVPTLDNTSIPFYATTNRAFSPSVPFVVLS